MNGECEFKHLSKITNRYKALFFHVNDKKNNSCKGCLIYCLKHNKMSSLENTKQLPGNLFPTSNKTGETM